MPVAALQALKGIDHTSYLMCLFVPDDKREAIAVIWAYAAELKRIPSLVSEPLPGEIRLQWWRDVIAGDRAGEAANHPVALNLLKAIAEYRLPTAPLIAMAEARIFDLYHDPMPDIAALETYLGETEATLIQFSCLILDPAKASKNAEASGHAGMAIGIAYILQNLRRTTARQQLFIPIDVLNALGILPDQIFAGDQQSRGKAVTAMAALGRAHLKKFQSLSKVVLPGLRPAFLQTALCEPVFPKAEKLGVKAFESEITIGPLLSQIRMTYRAMRGW